MQAEGKLQRANRAEIYFSSEIFARSARFSPSFFSLLFPSFSLLSPFFLAANFLRSFDICPSHTSLRREVHILKKNVDFTSTHLIVKGTTFDIDDESV